MLRISEKERPVKSKGRTSRARHGKASIPAYQPVVSGPKGRRMYPYVSLASDLHGPVRDLKREFSGGRSIYPEAGSSTVVRIYGRPESQPGSTDDNERSTLATHGYVVGIRSSSPTGDVIRPFDTEAIDFHRRMGVSAVPDFAEGEFPYAYRGRELSQGLGEIAQMTPTPTQGPVSLRQKYGSRVESQIELADDPRLYSIHGLLSLDSIPSDRGNPRDLSLVVEQLVGRWWAHPSDPESIADWGTISSRLSPLSDPSPVVADRLLEEFPTHSVSDLNVYPEVDPSLRPTWEDSDWSMAAAKLSEVWVQHPLARRFALGVDGETPTPSVVDMVERIVRTVEAKTTDCVYSVDEDGAFSFDAWLASGLFIMCEVDLYGEINAGLYHSPTGPQESFLPCITEGELLDNL